MTNSPQAPGGNMAAQIQFETLFDRDGLANAEVFPANVLELLGPSLKPWLQAWLASKGCEDSLVKHATAQVSEGAEITGAVYVDEGAKIDGQTRIIGPCYIGSSAHVRQGALIHGGAYIGRDAVVGHCTEVKASVFLDEAKAAHFNYVGDSVLGRDVNLGAGTKLANLRLKRDEVKFEHPETGERVGSGLTKFGALMGDSSQTGCNAVLSPGTILMPGALVFPCEHYVGTKKAK